MDKIFHRKKAQATRLRFTFSFFGGNANSNFYYALN